MVDISRDARWGRIMESAGEDVYRWRTSCHCTGERFSGR